MCRFIAYHGAPMFLDELVCLPRRSLLHQSLRAEEAKTATQGDGFGIGWYGERREPAIYRETMPAWSDENLAALCHSVKSSLFFAHIRAATGTAVTRQNCHPFQIGPYLFMHNGQIGGYAQVRRHLEDQLPDVQWAQRRGSTDSELIFLLALAHVARGLPLREAVLQVVEDVRVLLRRKGIQAPLRFAAAVADGQELHAFRLASDDSPPTLYVRKLEAGTVVASEPLDEHTHLWTALPVGGMLTLQAGSVHPHLQRVAELQPI
jgi:predicted glutamine amidotransferase